MWYPPGVVTPAIIRLDNFRIKRDPPRMGSGVGHVPYANTGVIATVQVLIPIGHHGDVNLRLLESRCSALYFDISICV